jgi:hypothetical protein
VVGSIDAGFNGTAVVGVGNGPAFIWFNSNLSVEGMTAGHSIFLTNSTVSIDGVPHNVPNAQITFSAEQRKRGPHQAGPAAPLTDRPSRVSRR